MKDEIKKYYGETLADSQDLKSNSCCCDSSRQSGTVADILELIDDEIKSKYYGCGSPLPPELSGCTVLDLGCGTGRDVYIASKLVGPEGRVIGVDMTTQQLEIARKHLDKQMRAFGYAKPNVEFIEGDIEDLKALGIEDNSIDVVISNCVINLAENKEAVFSEILRVLKPGGELFFADIFSDRRVPAAISSDPVMYNECLGGTLYIEDFRRLITRLGIADFRFITVNPIEITSEEVRAKAGDIDFYSVIIRLFNLNSLEDTQEDYGQTAEYLGAVNGFDDEFYLDRDNNFLCHVPTYVSANTARILQETRYATHFKVTGSTDSHFGRFDNIYFAGIAPESKQSCCGQQTPEGDKGCGSSCSSDGTPCCQK